MSRIGYKRLLRSLIPDHISKHRICFGPLRGSAIVTSWKRYPRAILGINDPSLTSWLARNVKSDETWLDVGAYVGYMSLAMARTAQRVFSFEASPQTFGLLARTCAANRKNIVPVPIGLGACPGLTRNTFGVTDSGMVSNYSDCAKESVLLASFDWLWPQINTGKPEVHGVKIDVEGNEFSVLRGMRESLLRWKPKLVIELHGASQQELQTVLDSCGYDPNPIRLPGDTAPLRPTEGRVCTYEFRAIGGQADSLPVEL